MEDSLFSTRTENDLIDRSLLLEWNEPKKKQRRGKQVLIHGKPRPLLREQKQRIDLIQRFGGCCFKCRCTKNLQLHHKYYAKHSIRPKVHNENGQQTQKRIKESLSNPERFQLLCLSCHNSLQPRRRSPVNLSWLFDR